jgi:predicted permease
MAALPPAANVLAVAQKYDSYRDQAATVILLGTAVSVITVTLVVAMVLGGDLPANP